MLLHQRPSCLGILVGRRALVQLAHDKLRANCLCNC